MAFTIIDAAITEAAEDGSIQTTPINGVPRYHTGTFGRYTGKYPYVAASKALTSIYRVLAASSPSPGASPPIVFVLRNEETGKRYAYLGERSPAPQSLDEPRVILGRYGRPRIYRWKNKISPIELESIGF